MAGLNAVLESQLSLCCLTPGAEASHLLCRLTAGAASAPAKAGATPEVGVHAVRLDAGDVHRACSHALSAAVAACCRQLAGTFQSLSLSL